MPLLRMVSPLPSPGAAALAAVAKTVVQTLGLPDDHCWVWWEQVHGAHQPAWRAAAVPAPIIYLTCKQSYSTAVLSGLLGRLGQVVASVTGCSADEVYCAVTRINAGELLVRGNVWNGDDMTAEDTSRPLSSASSMDPGAFVVTPIGFVRGARGEASDDFWGGAVSRIELDATQFGVDAVAELDTFSHLEVVFHFHLVKEGTEERGARRPRNNPEWPSSGIFAQRAKRRPNRLGVTRCRLVNVEGLVLTVEGLDAIDGTPVVDIKPYMREFDPRGEVRQPAWSTVVMEQYFAPHDAVPQSEPHA